MIRIAVLDDYQNVALEMADWSAVAGRAVITGFNDHLSKIDEIVDRLLPFDVVCVMRSAHASPTSRHRSFAATEADRVDRFSQCGHRSQGRGRAASLSRIRDTTSTPQSR